MLAWLRDIVLRVLSTLGLYSKNATIVLLGKRAWLLNPVLTSAAAEGMSMGKDATVSLKLREEIRWKTWLGLS